MCDYLKPLMAVKIRVGTLAFHDSTEGIAILGLLILSIYLFHPTSPCLSFLSWIYYFAFLHQCGCVSEL